MKTKKFHGYLIYSKNFLWRSAVGLTEWAALNNDCDYQQLVELCEPVFNNFISIFDSHAVGLH